MKYFSLALLTLSLANTWANSKSTLRISLADVLAGQQNIEKWIAEDSLVILEQDAYSTTSRLEYNLRGSESQIQRFQTKVMGLSGLRIERQSRSSSEERFEAQELRQKEIDCKVQADELMERYRKASNTEDLTALQSLLNQAQECVRTTQQSLRVALADSGKITLQLNIEADRPQNVEGQDGWFSFVNMPGGQHTWMSIENPNSQIAESYQGFGFRYLFFRSRTWASLSVLKPTTTLTDSTAWKDLLVWSVGTDFYSRLLGQGRRKVGNPYSGFAFGGTYLTSESDRDYYSWIAPHVGVELLRMPFVLVDVQASYQFPIEQKYSRELRAWQVQSALSLLF